MNIVRLLPAMCLLLLVGCKSDRLVSSALIPAQTHTVASASQTSTTNVYYMFDKGPGCAFFIKQSDYDAFVGSSTEGKRVVVIDGHFPSPSQMPASPTVSVSQSFPPLDSSRRDMSLIDDNGTR